MLLLNAMVLFCCVAADLTVQDGLLHKFVTGGVTEGVEWAITHGANINSQNPRGRTPLIMAVMEGDVPVTKVLVNYGADPNVQDYLEESALVKAAYMGNIEIAKILLGYGANVDEKAIMQAQERGNDRMVHLLQTGNDNVQIPDNDGETSLRRGALFGR